MTHIQSVQHKNKTTWKHKAAIFGAVVLGYRGIAQFINVFVPKVSNIKLLSSGPTIFRTTASLGLPAAGLFAQSYLLYGIFKADPTKDYGGKHNYGKYNTLGSYLGLTPENIDRLAQPNKLEPVPANIQRIANDGDSSLREQNKAALQAAYDAFPVEKVTVAHIRPKPKKETITPPPPKQDGPVLSPTIQPSNEILQNEAIPTITHTEEFVTYLNKVVPHEKNSVSRENLSNVAKHIPAEALKNLSGEKTADELTKIYNAYIHSGQ